MNIQEFTSQQLQMLLNYTRRHNIKDIPLDSEEGMIFYEGIKNSFKIGESWINLYTATAQAKVKGNPIQQGEKAGFHHRISISRENLIGDIDFFEGYNQETATSENHYNPFMVQLFLRLTEKFDTNFVIEKIAEGTSQRYSISKGQSRAVLHKILGYPLTSGTRSFLSDLRIKLRKYRRLVLHFEDYVKMEGDKKLSNKEFMTSLRRSFESNPPLLQEIVNELEKNSGLDKERGQEFKQMMDKLAEGAEDDSRPELPPLEKSIHHMAPVFHYCTICGFKIVFDKSEKQRSEPVHCENEMQLYIQSPTKDT